MKEWEPGKQGGSGYRERRKFFTYKNSHSGLGAVETVPFMSLFELYVGAAPALLRLPARRVLQGKHTHGSVSPGLHHGGLSI